MRKKTINLTTVNRSDIARKTGADTAHISRILSGQRNPSTELAQKIASALGVSTDTLLNSIPKPVCSPPTQDPITIQ